MYVYHDADGHPVHRTLRYRDPKSFRQQRYDHGRWRWNLAGITRVLYRLPELLAADPALPVWLPEGEKDCDLLVSLGLAPATTNPCGALSWDPSYTEWLRGRHVVILEDNDAAGYARTARLVEELTGAASAITPIRFDDLGVGGDVGDWLRGRGTVEALLRALGNDS